MPLCIILYEEKLETIPCGEKLEVITDDPTAKDTISGWCRAHRHEILEIGKSDDHIKIIILKH